MDPEQQSAKVDAPPSPYVPSRIYIAQIYWKKPAIVVLRVLQLVFSLIAFSVLADVLREAEGSITSSSYALAIGVIAFVYSVAQLSFSLWCIIRGATSSEKVTPFYQFATFICDQMITYLLISSGSSIASVLDLAVVCDSSDNSVCSRLHSSIAFVFLTFLAFAASSGFTGYYLMKCFFKA